MNPPTFHEIIVDIFTRYTTQKMVDEHLAKELTTRFDALENSELKLLKRNLATNKDLVGIQQSIQDAMVEAIDKRIKLRNEQSN